MPNYFSVSDVMTFLQCREKWDLSSPNRQSLRHKASPRLYLTMGSALHAAIDEQAKNADTDPVAVVQGYLSVERENQVAEYKAKNGFNPWANEMAKFDEAADLTEKLTAQYFEHYGFDNPLADQGLEYVATEVPFKVDISEIVGIPDSWFVGTFDGIAVDNMQQYWLVENKSYTQKPDIQDLMVHFQSTGYAVAWNLLTGSNFTGVLYNGVAKKLIKEPRRLKSGALSADVSQQTTYARFVDALSQDGVPLDDQKYVKLLKKLKDIEDQGDTRFFYREKVFFVETQLTSWLTEFYDIVHEMTDEPRIYRTVPYNGCGKQGADCWWRDICFAKHTGRDHESVIEESYEKGTYGTVESVDGIESVMVTSLDEMREALRNA